MLFGQVAKGVSLLAGAIVLGIFSGGLLALVMAIVSVVDGYQIGNKLQKGQSVGKWEFF